MPVRRHLNTLYVTSDGAYVRKEGRSLVVDRDGADPFRVPIHMLDSVVVLSRSGASPSAMALCADNGVSLAFLTPRGRFLARVEGATSGNVLLRRAQFLRSESESTRVAISRAIVIGKIHNVRVLLRRAARDHSDTDGALGGAADTLTGCLRRLAGPRSENEIRGIEGEAARRYFAVLSRTIVSDDPAFAFHRRTRRPPRDPVNALLSFGYALLANDVRSACESVGLDPQVGFLHRLRPGRASLALDLMEELRPVVAERVVLSVLNRGQVSGKDFRTDESGACSMSDRAREVFLSEYQSRKDMEVRHPFLDERISLGLVPLIQARLLAKYLREELDGYPPFAWK